MKLRTRAGSVRSRGVAESGSGAGWRHKKPRAGGRWRRMEQDQRGADWRFRSNRRQADQAMGSVVLFEVPQR